MMARRLMAALAACFAVLAPGEGAVHAQEVAAPLPAVAADVRSVRPIDAPALPDPVTRGADARRRVVRPGVNEIVVVAIDHINRLVTPFVVPNVVTANASEFQISQGVVYTAPRSEQPVTLYITEQGDESRAMSLTLVPQRVPPVEIHLVFGDGGAVPARTLVPASSAGAVSAAGPAGQQPYVEAIRNLVRSLALGDIPGGYQMASGVGAAVPACQPGSGFTVSFDRAQRFVGDSLEAVVGVVTRLPGGGGLEEFKEVWCGQASNIAAVALWPAPVLAPGDQAEIYVVRRLGGSAPPLDGRARAARPSLIGGY